MKSIIYEASTIAKAIEQSWKKTGKPQHFSVKILEEEEKNFLGMTRKPAKIAFFFEETTTSQRKKTDQRQQRKSHKQTSNQKLRSERQEKVKPEKKSNTEEKAKTLLKQNKTLKISMDKKDKATTRKTTRKSPWTDQMVAEAKNWITGILKEMNMSHVNFSVKTSGNNLKFHFETPLIKNKEKQKSLFRNFAFLIMQSMRYKFKKQFRNLKAVFTSN